MLIYRKPIGTAAFLGGLHTVLEEFCWSWGQMVQYNTEYLCAPGEYVHYDRSKSSDKSGSRNALAARFLGEWLFMSDTDHKFEPDVLHRMVSLLYQANVDVITGVYRLKEHPFLPVLFHWDEPSGKYAYIEKMDWDAPLIEVHAAGAGCLLVRRSVFERIEKELGEKPFNEIHPYSEDFSFYARCRKLNIKIYCAPQITSNHLVIKEITHADYDGDSIMSIPA